MTDLELLGRYANSGDEQAFAELVARHKDWMSAAARRRMRDPQLADDAVQAAFILLARKPPKLRQGTVVSSWLFRVLHFTCLASLRRQRLRKHHEQQAAAMNMRTREAQSAERDAGAAWEALSPRLEAFVAGLREADRRAVLLRFYERKSFAQVGSAMGITEDAARKRVTRAVQRLSGLFARHGVTVPAVALGAVLIEHVTPSATAAVVGHSAAAAATASAALAAAQGAALTAGTSGAAAAAGAASMLAWAQAKAVTAIVFLTLTAVAAIGGGAAAVIAASSRPAATTKPQVAAASTAPLVVPLAMLSAATTAPTTPLRVQLVDPGDKSVGGADVFVFYELYPDKNDENPQVIRLGPVKSDATGSATIQIPQPTTQPKWTRTSVFARIPGKMIGATIAQHPEKAVKVLTVSAAPMKGKVTVPSSFHARDVKVSLLSLMVSDGTASSSGIYPGHDKWPQLFEYAVADDGSFVVPEVPLKGSAYLAGNAKGLGEAQYMSLDAGPAGLATLDLLKEGVIEGTLTHEGEKTPVAGVKIYAHPSHTGGLVSLHPYTAATDTAGKFRIDGLPESFYTLGLAWASDAPEWVMPNRENVLVKSGQTVRDIQLQLERGALVLGEVRDAQTGEALKGVNVAALNPASSVNATGIGSSQTDGEGHYLLRLPVGRSKLYLSGWPDGYVPPPQKEATFEVTVAKDDTHKEGPAFTLLRAPTTEREPLGKALLRGRVVDTNGKPVAGAHIADDRIEKWGGDDMPVQDNNAATTDADGRFEFKAAAGIQHRLFVSDRQWQHDETHQFVPKKDQTFTHADIVVRERPLVGTITGVVTDPAGKPLDGVMVGFWSGIRTDADGKFSMDVRGENKPVMIELRKPGYAVRNWNDVPPNAKEVRFVLHPGTRAEAHLDKHKQPPEAKQVIGKPAPPLDAETWIHLPTSKPPELPAKDGRKTFIVFDWSCDRPDDVRKTLAALDAETKKANARAILIFGPHSHERGVRAMLGAATPDVSIAIDRFIPDCEYDVSGATIVSYGFGRMPHAFVVDDKGIVRHEQIGVVKLADAAKQN